MKERPWRWMYNTREWKVRRTAQLVAHPLCAQCLKAKIIKAATVVHHVTPHKGDFQLFCSSALESLCKSCHDAHTASVERSGIPVKPRIGLDGWPIE